MEDVKNSEPRCPLCQEPLGNMRWPHIRAAFANGSVQLCHLECVRRLATDDNTHFDEAFVQGLFKIIKQSPSIEYMNPHLRICYEEQRMELTAVSGKRPSWPPSFLPPPPPVAFALEGLLELRISGCSALQVLPPEIGRIHGMRSLILISNGLSEVPEEVASLQQLKHLFINGNFLRSVPTSIGSLPCLKELCLDGNQLEVLPNFTSTDMTLFTAAGNRLRTIPALAGRMERLEFHGNLLESWIASSPPLVPCWSYMVVLKLMGNRLRTLPEELGQMRWLRIFMVPNNLLEVLPDCVTSFHSMEWCFVYQNQLRELPSGLLTGSHQLGRVLLEGNPLSPASLAQLLATIPQARQSTLKVGLDNVQALNLSAFLGTSPPPLPPNVVVGTLRPVDGPGQYFLKHLRASQLRRAPGLSACGEPGGPPDAGQASARLLVVALAASQGEPEWLGLLRRLYEQQTLLRLPPPTGSLAEMLKDTNKSDTEACLSELWAGCRRFDGDADAEMNAADAGVVLGDFDVLSAIDHRMRWYSEDAPALGRVLQEICAPYERVLFVGASMGGFGSLRHGGRLADAVLAFSPQANLPEASLRPPADGPQDLALLAEQMFESIQIASAAGALVSVHCAADENLQHALTLPKANVEVTVHPLLPRKPFARLLDRASLLLPIVADMVARLLQAPPRVQGSPRGGFAESRQSTVACWRPNGTMTRCFADPCELLGILFRPGATSMPRPGDWFCQRCKKRNMSRNFFCYECGTGAAGAEVSAAGTVAIPGHNYPQKGDWGCGGCGQAYCGYEDSCKYCGIAKWGGHERTIIVS